MNFFRIGRILKPHGVRGAFKVLIETDFPERFSRDESIIIEHQGEHKHFTLEEVKYLNNGMVVLKAEGIDSPEEAVRYKNAGIVVTEEELTSLEEGMYYYHDLIGCRLVQSGEEIGVVTDVFFNGGTDIYVAETGDGRTVMIPAVTAFVKNVDIGKKEIRVELIEGMIE
jgi:16S rRNA processing protein RimM